MNYKALIKALQFACIPTISVLILLCFGFFSITKVLDFISSDNPLAIALRIILFIAEILLIWWMYDKYNTEDIRNSLLNNENNNLVTKSFTYSTYIGSAFPNSNHNDSDYRYISYHTENKNRILIEKVLKS